MQGPWQPGMLLKQASTCLGLPVRLPVSYPPAYP